ncbi:uncharacterized protein N7469_009443 [Penicillium citrinum]|uniref:Uncharacterized protein n=1 Tax=Penicillium citrinum TaxID=5077 RepID=A0A9W9THT5_PENCI|nr:uncharacterized protein N7469_009443 [Penicillium citrinum]KAJ5223203.1 hypothetical protein N7469_009443 [Penicillium citrinum]
MAPSTPKRLQSGQVPAPRSATSSRGSITPARRTAALSSASRQTTKYVNLDASHNPVASTFSTELDRNLLAMDLLRATDWRSDPKDCRGPRQLRAAFAQRVGIVASPGYACISCGNGHGPFGGCVATVVNGDVLLAVLVRPG